MDSGKFPRVQIATSTMKLRLNHLQIGLSVRKSIDDVPPCQRCTLLKRECIPNSFPVACKSCRRDKKRDAILPSVETYEDAEKPVENQIQTTTPQKPQMGEGSGSKTFELDHMKQQ